MSLSVGCPRCSTPVAQTGQGSWSCPDHGVIAPLWRPAEASYEEFVAHLGATARFPTYLPWPLSPGWRVTDFAAVGDETSARAAMTCVSGTSALDGPVDVLVITEEPGTGLGARIAGTVHDDPGTEVGDGPPSVRVRIDSQSIPLWPVSTSAASGEWDRSVVAGEAQGRWLWMVLRPASAVLLLRDDWILRDVSGLGPPLVELPFGDLRLPGESVVPGATWLRCSQWSTHSWSGCGQPTTWIRDVRQGPRMGSISPTERLVELGGIATRGTLLRCCERGDVDRR